MGSWKDRFNIKKIMEELNSEENEFELEEKEAPKEYEIFDQLTIDIPELVAPESAVNEENYFKVGDDYTRTLYIHTYPQQVEDNWLREVLRFQHAIDVAIYIHPVPIKPWLHKTRQQVARDEAAINKEIEDGLIPDGARQARLRDALQMITAIEEDVTKPFTVMVAFTLRARSEKQLNKITEELERHLTAVTTRQLRHRHKQGFMTTLPVMTNKMQEARMKAMRPIHTQGLMSMFPFTSSDVSHESGVMVGLSQISGSPIILNRFMQPVIQSPNTAILGSTGSGKSYFAKLEMLRWAYHGVPAMVLDPSGEYRRVCEALGGANIDISLDSEQVINPLDFSNAVRPGHNALREKIAFMVELLRIMVKTEGEDGVPIDAMTKQIFENALIETYRRYRYVVSDIDSQQAATPENMPTLAEVWFVLSQMAKAQRDPELQKRVHPLLAALASFVGDGHLAPLFDQRTTVDLRSHFINFDYHNLAPQYLPLAMYLVLEFIRTSYFTVEQAESGINRLLYVDESQIMMSNPETAKFLEWTARTCRKYGIGLTVMTQDVGVFVLTDEGRDNKVGQGILSNCSIRVLFKQQPSETEALQRQFKLTQGEIQRLLSAAAGEGLLFVGDEVGWFTARDQASPPENEICSTSPVERAEIERRKRAELEAKTEPPPIADDHLLTYEPEEPASPPPELPPEPFAPPPSSRALPGAPQSPPPSPHQPPAAPPQPAPPPPPAPPTDNGGTPGIAAEEAEFDESDFDDSPFG